MREMRDFDQSRAEFITKMDSKCSITGILNHRREEY